MGVDTVPVDVEDMAAVDAAEPVSGRSEVCPKLRQVGPQCRPRLRITAAPEDDVGDAARRHGSSPGEGEEGENGASAGAHHGDDLVIAAHDERAEKVYAEGPASRRG